MENGLLMVHTYINDYKEMVYLLRRAFYNSEEWYAQYDCPKGRYVAFLLIGNGNPLPQGLDVPRSQKESKDLHTSVAHCSKEIQHARAPGVIGKFN